MRRLLDWHRRTWRRPSLEAEELLSRELAAATEAVAADPRAAFVRRAAASIAARLEPDEEPLSLGVIVSTPDCPAGDMGYLMRAGDRVPRRLLIDGDGYWVEVTVPDTAEGAEGDAW